MSPPANAPEMNDVIETPGGERREDVRIIVSLPGRYMLANKRSPKGDRCEFACRVVNVSLHAMALAAPVLGQPGERVIVHTAAFGRLHGPLTRVITNGFVMAIAASSEEREKLRAKLAWLAMKKDDPDTPDGRR